MNKKGQQEIAGFVLIIVIVLVMGVFFLSFMINTDEEDLSSIEVSHFLQASMYYTTDCSVGFSPDYKSMQDLIKACYKSSGDKCNNGKDVCESLEDEFKKVIDGTWKIGDGSPNKAYNLEIYFRSEKESPIEPIFSTSEGIYGNCSSQIGAGHNILITGTSSGIIYVEFEICKED